MSNARKRRFEQLGELLAAMRVLRLRMLNSMEPLGILLRKSDSVLFQYLGNNLWEGGGLAETWLNLRTKAIKNPVLNDLQETDMRILDVFFQNLGKSGKDEQYELFARIISEIEETQNLAKNRYLDAARLFTALGTLVGIGICILIV